MTLFLHLCVFFNFNQVFKISSLSQQGQCLRGMFVVGIRIQSGMCSPRGQNSLEQLFFQWFFLRALLTCRILSLFYLRNESLITQPMNIHDLKIPNTVRVFCSQYVERRVRRTFHHKHTIWKNQINIWWYNSVRSDKASSVTHFGHQIFYNQFFSTHVR